MSKLEKLKQKVKNRQTISYDEAETLLTRLGFAVRSKGSHHTFSKDGYVRNISLKKCPRLLLYQIDLIAEAIEILENKESIKNED
jgi:predicted RNA binding protein YcfA (HicA-like mRNA interferase family)